MAELEKRITENLGGLRSRIGAAAERGGRKPENITLVVVVKNRTPEEITAVINAGERNIGENRVQEAKRNRPSMPEGITYRMIGHLQRNKAADAVKLFDAIDTIDSMRLGISVSEELRKVGRTMPVLVQVNSSAEETKHGFEPEEVEEAVGRLGELPGLEIRGLMTIGPLTDDEGEMRRAFDKTRRLYEAIKPHVPGFDTLSMGMSDDFEIAIEEGSNMVRVGRAVFEGR